jgi:acetylornithine deacetylase/succinyl-diaminopimelate desuccinylase-like protein
MTYTCFKLDALTPSLWRTTFNNPPINLIDVGMIAELRELFVRIVRIERDEGPAVLIFESADPDYGFAVDAGRTAHGESGGQPDRRAATKLDAFTDPAVAAIEEVTGRRPELITSGGTSDARFIASYCPVIEFGLVGQTMQQIDERPPVSDLEKLTSIYRGILDRYFA